MRFRWLDVFVVLVLVAILAAVALPALYNSLHNFSDLPFTVVGYDDNSGSLIFNIYNDRYEGGSRAIQVPLGKLRVVVRADSLPGNTLTGVWVNGEWERVIILTPDENNRVAWAEYINRHLAGASHNYPRRVLPPADD